MNVCSADRDIPSLHYHASPCLQLYFISLAYTKPTLIHSVNPKPSLSIFSPGFSAILFCSTN